MKGKSKKTEEVLLIPQNGGAMYESFANIENGGSVMTNGDVNKICLEEAHCHSLDTRPTGIDKIAVKRLAWATAISFVSMILVYIGGVMANSLTVLADGACLTSDVTSFAVNLLTVYLSTRHATTAHNFGLHRGEVLGGILSILLLWVVTAAIIVMAIFRLFNQDYTVHGLQALITGIFGLAVDPLLLYILYQDDLPCFKKKKDTKDPKKPHNISVDSAFWHMIGDTIQSIGVMLSTVVMYFKPEWHLTDPIAAIIFSAVVYVVSAKFVKDALYILMEASPKILDYNAIRQALNNIEGVVVVHDLRLWSLNPARLVASVHLAVDSSKRQRKDIQEEACKLLRMDYFLYDTTVQLEEYIPDMQLCLRCIEPSEKLHPGIFQPEANGTRGLH